MALCDRFNFYLGQLVKNPTSKCIGIHQKSSVFFYESMNRKRLSAGQCTENIQRHFEPENITVLCQLAHGKLAEGEECSMFLLSRK